MEKWSGLPTQNGIPRIARATTSNASSKKNTPHKSAIEAAWAMGGVVGRIVSVAATSMKPSQWLPASPRKTRAGGALKTRKPKQAPAVASHQGESSCGEAEAAISPIAASPATSPSQTSVRFTALITTRIKNADRAPSSQGHPKKGYDSPPATER